jgi:hypothetical protein
MVFDDNFGRAYYKHDSWGLFGRMDTFQQAFCNFTLLGSIVVCVQIYTISAIKPLSFVLYVFYRTFNPDNIVCAVGHHSIRLDWR